MILYPMFYRKYGVRRLSQLTTPALHGIDKLELPRDTIFHYKGVDATEVGISPDDPVLRHAEKIVMVDHVVELVEKKGPPRTTNQLPAKFIRDYHRRYRRLRPLRKMDSVLRDPRTMVVVNYAVIPHLVRYTTSFFSNYYAWYNIQATMWSKVAELARETDRHQFIRFSLPKHLPSLVDLKKAEQTIARNTLDAFNNDISLDILDIWTWLGENRENSPMSKLGNVDLNKINLVWVEAGRWFTINLGLLSDWRIGGEGDVSNEAVAVSLESQGTDSYNLQRRFLRALMTLFEAKTVVAADIAPEEVEEEEEVEDTTEVEVEVDPLSQSSRDRIVADLGDEEEIPDFDLPKVENAPIISPTLTDDEIEADLRELERRVEVMDEVPPYVPESATLEDAIIRRCDELVDQGMMSAAEYRRLNKLASRYKEAINPYGGNQTIEDFIKVSPEDLKVSSEVKLPINSPVLRFDPSFAKSSLKDLDRDYINKILPKNIVANVMAIQRAGIAVADYQIDEVEDVMNHYEVHTVRLVPAVGAPSTVRFRVPKVAENGIFRANGVKYRLRRQRADKPIRKTGPNRVALTSYHSKLFVERSEKRVNNYAKWLCSFITEAGLDTQNSEITEMKPSAINLGEVELPFIYTTLASHYRSFTANGIEFYFDYHKRQAKFGEDVVKGLEKKGFVVVGKQAGNKAKFVLVDKSDTFYYADGDQLDVIGKIHDILTIDPNTSPLEMAEVKIFNKNIPLGVVLGAKLGLSGLLKLLKAEPRRVPKGERLNLQPNEYAIRFNDETLIFDKEDRQTMLIVSGFAQYRNAIKRYSTHDFDRQEVYYNILEVNGVGGHYVREINLLYDTFIDPITGDLLKEMKEPTDMVNLFLRSAELLLTDHHPPETMMPYMRLRGYERLAGAVYGELIRAVRGYNSKPRSSAAKVEMKPQAVWNSILQDPALSLVDETNPIQNLKEVECVTFTGVGGRSMRSMVERSRIYDKSDMGVISESTTDSSTVGVIAYTPPDPKVNSLYGTTDSYDKRKDGAARLLSTSALLSPAADMDDPKRVNFIAIQQAHGVATKGYRTMPLNTGYERVIASRTDDIFATTASVGGKVLEVSPNHIKVEYQDGRVQAIELGERFGVGAGAHYSHQLTTGLKAGETFEAGDTIAYNSDFFAPDFFNSKGVVWKAGVLATTAVMETVDTLEDSSAISERLAKELTTKTVKNREIVLNFNQAVRNLVSQGDNVDLESILCTIEDAVTADSDLFDDDSLDMLKVLSAQTPRAKFAGKVAKVEVYYHGDKEDMSESLRAIANESDKRMGKVNRRLGRRIANGRVDGSYRVGGNPLELDTLVIKIAIVGEAPAGVGDKGVFGNQMKTIFGRVMSGTNETADGRPIDAIFGFESINARIVSSPIIIGTFNTLLKVLSKKVAETYRKK